MTALQHGIKREVFAAPLSTNYRDFLSGDTDTPEFNDRPVGELMSYFSQRWLLPRAERDTRYKDVLLRDICKQVRAEL